MLGAVLGPLALNSLYLAFSRWTNLFTPDSDWLFLYASVGFGTVCIACLPLHPIGRLAIACMFIPYVLFLLFICGLFFGNPMGGDWL